MGASDGESVGSTVGASVGPTDGVIVGVDVVGESVGERVGENSAHDPTWHVAGQSITNAGRHVPTAPLRRFSWRVLQKSGSSCVPLQGRCEGTCVG